MTARIHQALHVTPAMQAGLTDREGKKLNNE